MALHEGRRIGFEFKCADAPGMTRSLGIALTDLKLDRAFVVYPGATRYPLSDRVEAIPLSEMPTLKP
jgi:hypothetical protein